MAIYDVCMCHCYVSNTAWLVQTSLKLTIVNIVSDIISYTGTTDILAIEL